MSGTNLSPVPGPEALAAFSVERDEPAWLSEFRQESLRKFGENPHADGRYTRLKLGWEGLPTATPSFPAGALPAQGLVHATQAPSPALALAPWATREDAAFRDLVRPRQPFDHLVFASWAYGLVFRWRETDAGGPVSYLAPEPKPGLVMEPILLDVGEGSTGELLIRWEGGGDPGLRLTALSGRVGPRGTLRLVLLGEGGEGHHHITLNLDLAEDAKVEIFGVWAGGRWTVLRGEATMAALGSSWKETHVVWGGGKDHTDIETRVLHLAPRTRSDIHVRAALSDRARCAFAGNIVMEKEAVLADARLEDHVLLLSESARSDSVPALEIRAMDVKASHAASTGPVDPEALFYLLSRGLDEVQARHLLVKGFLASLVDRAPFPLLTEMLDTQLESRVTR